jgi:hypothetical protein
MKKFKNIRSTILLKNIINQSKVKGFNINNIETGSWGNKKSVISNLRNDDKWTRVGFYSKLNNEKNFPVQVWGLAKI